MARIAEDARRRGYDGKPLAALELAREYRLGAVRVPVALGGAGYSLRDLLELVIELGAADPDVPHILRAHWGFVEERLTRLDDPRDRGWLEQVVGGTLFGGAGAERSSRAVGTYVFDTTLLPDGDAFRLNGRKYYSTGSQYSDVLRISANDADGEQLSVLIPADRDGVIHADDWNGIGQRQTGSGTTILDNVVVYPEEVLDFRGWTDAQTRRRQPLPHLLLHAVAAGILRSVTADAAELIRSRPRPYAWAPTSIPAEDPQLLQVVGELSSAAFVVEGAVLRAAEFLDRAADHLLTRGSVDPDLELAASLATSKVKVGVEDIALRAAGQLFAAGGASAVDAAHHLDRHWRNLRTLFSHNPTVYKARVVGDVVVNDAALPPVGFF
ncbi:acyl-CoA dehydrogenase [Millisia brevis]|uniref:acyl-CoA dehydrogenase n=1 Tax=Millisia brevis TaxID=264148 RepID=UPI00083019D2|nr:acyl-CoA dehydrogenase [Millisia brevis]